jgi:hypothetical protein
VHIDLSAKKISLVWVYVIKLTQIKVQGEVVEENDEQLEGGDELMV